MQNSTPNWTPQQLQAINSRGKDILVSASAGSGKTTVMIRRILSLLEEGYQLKDMLIVTFTVAAAADMKEKLSKQLSASINPKLKAQLNDLADADISTLHGWCKRLISAYFYQIGADPEFSVAEDTERAAMLSRAADKALKDAAESADADFLELLEIFGDSADDKRLKSLMIKAFNNTAITPKNSRDRPVLTDGEYKTLLFDDIKMRRDFLVKRAQELSLKTAQAKFDRNIDAINALIESIKNYIAPPRAPYGKVLPEFIDLNEEYKQLKARAEKLAKAYTDAINAGEQSGKYLAVLQRLQTQTAAAFVQFKRDKGLLDFNDMEHYALELLDSPAGEEIRARYKFIFVDEYQDINPLQDELITKIHQGNRLFLVGDLKQSIYAFRGCEPSIFAEKFQTFCLDADCEVIELNANHRSCDRILSYVNDVFGKVMTGEFGGADYAARGAFTLNGKAGDGVRLHLCPQDYERQKEEVYDLTRHRSPKNSMAQAAAGVIAEILAYKTVEENGKTRPALKKDIAVLCRSLNGETPAALAGELAALNIKTNFSHSSGAGAEAQTLTAYLRLINNRFDDGALINSMRGYFGGFTDAELAEIVKAWPDAEFFYQAVENFLCNSERSDESPASPCHPEQSQGSHSWELLKNINPRLKLKAKISEFFSQLNKYRALSQTLPVCRLAGKIVSDFNYFQYIFTKGEAAAEALDKFLLYIAGLRNQTLCGFLTETADAEGGETASAGDAVNFMTVHAAKGLEFPFVLLLNAEKRFNLRDLNEPILVYKQDAAIKCYDWETMTVRHSAGWLYNHSRLKKRLLEEELRLLYVALTRAKYRLDIFADADNADDCGKDPSECITWLHWLLQSPNKPVCDSKEEESDFCHPELANDPPHGTTHSQRSTLNSKKLFPPADPLLVTKIQRRFDNIITVSDAPPKAYVTAVTHQSDEENSARVFFKDDRDDGVDKDGADKRKSGADGRNTAEMGTLYHKAMEVIDFFADFDAQWDGLNAEIKSRVNKNEIRAAASAMRELCADKKYYKEQGFMLKLPASEISLGGDEDVLLQGVIDLLIIDGEECIIVDYKTGAFNPDYEKQLYYYALAAQRILRLKVKGKMLYMFKENRTILLK